jgi:hypothetical protein
MTMCRVWNGTEHFLLRLYLKSKEKYSEIEDVISSFDLFNWNNLRLSSVRLDVIFFEKQQIKFCLNIESQGKVLAWARYLVKQHKISGQHSSVVKTFYKMSQALREWMSIISRYNLFLNLVVSNSLHLKKLH